MTGWLCHVSITSGQPAGWLASGQLAKRLAAFAGVASQPALCGLGLGWPSGQCSNRLRRGGWPLPAVISGSGGGSAWLLAIQWP